MTYEDFKRTWTGRAADFDGWYGAQCVDLFNFYNRDVVGAGPLFTPDTGGAADLWNDFSGPGNTAYTKIPNTPEGVPQPGDVMLWAANSAVTGAAGHVGIFDSGDVNGFYSFDQNYPTGSLPHLQHHDYRGVLGWLRPKNNQGGSMSTLVDNRDLAALVAHAVLLRPTLDDEFYNSIKDQPLEVVLAALDKSPEHMAVIDRFNAVTGLQQQVTEVAAALTDAQTALSTRDSLIADLKAQLNAQQQQLDATTTPVVPPSPLPVPPTPPLPPQGLPPTGQPQSPLPVSPEYPSVLSPLISNIFALMVSLVKWISGKLKK